MQSRRAGGAHSKCYVCLNAVQATPNTANASCQLSNVCWICSRPPETLLYLSLSLEKSTVLQCEVLQKSVAVFTWKTSPLFKPQRATCFSNFKYNINWGEISMIMQKYGYENCGYFVRVHLCQRAYNYLGARTEAKMYKRTQLIHYGRECQYFESDINFVCGWNFWKKSVGYWKVSFSFETFNNARFVAFKSSRRNLYSIEIEIVFVFVFFLILRVLKICSQRILSNLM